MRPFVEMQTRVLKTVNLFEVSILFVAERVCTVCAHSDLFSDGNGRNSMKTRKMPTKKGGKKSISSY